MTRAASDRNPPLPTVGARAERAFPRQSSRLLWLWVAAGFLFLAIGWTIMFTVACATKIQSVPLATQGARP